jgi:hypothetical protein
VSVTVEASSISYNGNSIADEFAVPFKFLETDDLLVRTTTDAGETYTTLVEGVGYTVDGEGEDSGGTVTTTDPVATGTTIVIERNTDITQESDFAPQGAFPVARHETALDKLTLICQELDRRLAAQEALGDGVDVPELADAEEISDSITPTAPVEAFFPMQIACAGGINARTVIWHVAREDNAPMVEPPQVDWRRGPDNNITINYISGLEAGTEYSLVGLVFFPA